jgi:peptide deformylase
MNIELITIPDERLRQKCEPIETIDSHIHELADAMLAKLGEVYNNQRTIGYAAPQFGEMVRLIVIKLADSQPIVLVNPVIARQHGTHAVIEGCRSIPGKLYRVQRPLNVKVWGLNLAGMTITVKGYDLLAASLVHETQHCDGIMIDQVGQMLTDEEVAQLRQRRD